MTIIYQHYGEPNLPPYIVNGLPVSIAPQAVTVSFSARDDRGNIVQASIDLTLVYDPGGAGEATYQVIINGVFQSGYGGTITPNAFNGFDVVVDTHPNFAEGTWEAQVYVEDDEAASGSADWQWEVVNIPVSATWNVFDFCEPDDATMLTLFLFPDVTAYRPGGGTGWFNGSNDYCMLSDDELETGFRIDTPIPNDEYTLQFTILPTLLPPDFSSLSTNRFFTGVYNVGGYAVGLLLSENGGIALATDPENVIEVFPDSADLINEGTTYYTFRVTVDGATGEGVLYVTRKDVLLLTGVHELRYTFTAPLSPAGLLDHVVVSLYGTAGDPTQICLDCTRLSDDLVTGVQRPVTAVSDPDQARRAGDYGYFDGRDSYDQDDPDQPLTLIWTLTGVPDGSSAWLEGDGTSAADNSGYINYLTGAAGTFSDVEVGDLVIGDLITAPVVYVADDGSELAAGRDVFVADTTVRWKVIHQNVWGGAWRAGMMVYVQSSGTTPPGTPLDGGYYLVTATATGDWAGEEGNLALWSATSGWSFITAPVGALIYSIADHECFRYAGSALWYEADPWVEELNHWDGRKRVIGAILSDAPGIYNILLTANNGIRLTTSSIALLNAQAMESERNVVPDMSFIWKNVPGEFWELVEDREVFETFWSEVAQLAAGNLLELWQNQIAIDLFRMQRTFEIHWLNYDLRIDLPVYTELPATVLNTVNEAGFSATPNIIPTGGTEETAYSYSLDDGGVGDDITAGSPCTLDDPGGAFTADHVGRMITITGAASADDNGTFPIVGVASSTQLTYTNASSVGEIGGSFTYVIGLSGITASHYLVVGGVAYRLLRSFTDVTINANVVVTEQAMPTGTDRSGYWMIRPTATSDLVDFGASVVTAADTAVFEVRDADDVTIDVEAFIYGVRDYTIVFDDTDLATYIANEDVSVFLKAVLRRSQMDVHDLIMTIPQLQEVINYANVDGAPLPLYEGPDYILETVNPRVITFLDLWFETSDLGLLGDYSAANVFEDLTATFTMTLGEVGTDLSNYLLEFYGARYRLGQVLSDTQLELFDDALEPTANGEWKVLEITNPVATLWAEITNVDNRPIIERNFGSLIGFGLDHLADRTDDLDYLSAVQGLWYYVYNARTISNTRLAAQIILGLPFAEADGTILDIREYDLTRTQVIVRDTEDTTIVRSYIFPTIVGLETNPDTGVDFVAGDTITKFSPISEGVDVEDYLSDEDWWSIFAGSGDFFEPQKLSNFGVQVSAEIFELINLEFLANFLRQHRAEHRDVYFSVLKTFEDIIDVADLILLGPVVPEAYTYPDGWDAYVYPYPWTNSPHEVPRAALDPYDPADPNTWATNPPVPPNPGLVPMGNMFLRDSPGSVPDGWDSDDIAAGNLGTWATDPLGPEQSSRHAPTISEGSMTFDETDQSGRYIHRFADGAVDLLTDGDMELVGTANWPTVDVGGMGLSFTAVKDGAIYHGSSGQSLHITGVGTHHGVGQSISPETVDENFQVGVRLWVYLVTGQCYIRILDQDNPQNVVAEWRHNTGQLSWQEITLHAWRAPAQDTNYYTVQILSGPAGGEFYVDDVAFYRYLMPWSQWLHDMAIRGRTGGYTLGGLPDDVCDIQVALPVP